MNNADMHPAEDAKNVFTAHKAPISAWYGLSINNSALPALKPNPVQNAIQQVCEQAYVETKPCAIHTQAYIQTTG